MGYKFTKLSDVPVVAEFPEGANAIIEADGEIKRCPSAGGSAENVQTDYNQNDSTAADYMKNRPFYTGSEGIVKIDKKYLPFLPEPIGESYLTFSSLNSFTLTTPQNAKTWDGTLEYFASDETWTIWDGTSSLSAEPNGSRYVMYLRGTGNTVIANNHGWQLYGSDIACIGNIETLLDYATVESGGHPVMADYCCSRMFQYCTSLTQAPELPATTLAEHCYSSMFEGCDGLTRAPKLPAATLASYCYESMFLGCSSLAQVPELPATTLAGYCYQMMFQDCISLTQIPELPAIGTEANCYLGMFRGCTSLKLSTTQTGEYTQDYRIPSSGDGTTAAEALNFMFDRTGGTFTGTPSINTTYYLSSDNMIVRGNEIANLNGYVQSMIDNAGYIIPSSTPNSTKKFKITVDDSGTISATEVI